MFAVPEQDELYVPVRIRRIVLPVRNRYNTSDVVGLGDLLGRP